jgi:hypothetical protein
MLEKLLIGGGRVDETGDRLRLTLPPTSNRVYADAQLDDYHHPAPKAAGRGVKLAHLTDCPPRRLTLRARASHLSPAGTLGFGFWNDPFSLSGSVLAAPNSVWFFYASPPSDMALVEGVPGWGWKAATLKAGHPPRLLFIPAALAAIALTHLPGLGRLVMATARRAVRAYESVLDDVRLTDWHEYDLEWRPDVAVFRVDGVERLWSLAPPSGPLGFVLWIDNQYAIASRAGKFGFGLCPVREEQWLEVEGLRLE